MSTRYRSSNYSNYASTPSDSTSSSCDTACTTNSNNYTSSQTSSCNQDLVTLSSDPTNHFVRQVNQKNHFRPYEPASSSYENCNDFAQVGPPVCNLGDWAFDTTNSGLNCPDRPRCSALDPSVCPNINNSLVRAAWADAPTVNCSYDKTQFTSAEDIDEYICAFGEDDVYTNQLIPYFCTENNFTIAGNSDEAQLCINWAEANPDLVEKTLVGKCSAADNSRPECNCIHRVDNPIYQAMKKDALLADVDDSCWWRACENTLNPSIALSAGVSKCPPNLCEILNQVYISQRIYETYSPAEVEAVIVSGCTINSVVIRGVGPVVRKSNVVWLILGVLFFIFIIGIVIYLAVKGQQQQKKVEET